MGKFPFTIRPIKLDEAVVHTEPLSLPNDLSGKMTLSSKHASVQLSELSETLRHKDVATIIAENGDEEVILSTNTILRLSRANDDDPAQEEKKYWPIPVLFGFVLGAGMTSFFSENIHELLTFTVTTSAFCGILVGLIWQKFYDSHLKKGMQNWMKNFVDDE